MKGVVLEQPVGEVWVVRGGQRTRATRTLALKDLDTVETGTNSYVPSIHDNPSPASGQKGSDLCLFPNTRVVLSIRRGLIAGVEIHEGLVGAFTEAPVVTPTAEWCGSAWAEVAPNGDTVVAASRVSVRHRPSGRVVAFTDPDGRQQIRVSADGIAAPEVMDQRFSHAREIWENRGAFYAASLYGQMAASMAAGEEKLLATFGAVADRFGLDMEAVRQSLAQQQSWLQAQAASYGQEAAAMQQADLGRATLIPIDQIVEYQGVSFRIVSAKREPARGETDRLSLQVEAENRGANPVFVFYSEEVRLIGAEGQAFAVDDYTLETALEPGRAYTGYLIAEVGRGEERLTLQWGKRSLPKVELALDLSGSGRSD
ncbi:MAG: hypothetical protein K6V36_08905 [Anaerolineae bacterium]|nr:hypothetical protein [Anaerolineae bacterium]